MVYQGAPASTPKAIFNHAAKAIEIEDIEAGVTDLELAAKALCVANS